MLTFLFLGVGLLFFAWVLYNTDLSEDEEPMPSEESPWRVREEWRDPEITDVSPLEWRPSGLISSVLTPGNVVVLNLGLIPLAGFLIYKQVVVLPQPNLEVFYVLAPLLLLDGGAIWETLIRPKLHWRKYGASTLRMETMPARLGRHLRARLQTGVFPEKAPDDGFTAELSCYEQYIQIIEEMGERDEKQLERSRNGAKRNAYKGDREGKASRFHSPFRSLSINRPLPLGRGESASCGSGR